MRRISYLLVTALVMLLGGQNLMAQDKALKAPKKIVSVEGITEYQLENGLKVLLFPDPSKQTITVNVTYLVGSANEKYGETGLAHLIEHMVFKGTPNHPNIPQELTEHGARPNGTTWLDRTNYFETFRATDENLEWALDMEADRMVNSFIAKKDLESEMTVVINEFESGENNPFRVMLQRLLSTSYLWHNYGNSTIGSREDVENVPIEVLQAFYRKYYQPDNAVLLVAGKFDPEKTLDIINQKFGVIPRPERVLETNYTWEPTQDGERYVSLKRVGDVQYLGAVYHVSSGAHPDFAPISVMSEILRADATGRMYKNLVDTKLASSVFGFDFQLKDPGVILFMAEVRKDQDVEKVKEVFTKTLDDMAQNPPTEEEVNRAKTKLLKDIELALNSSTNVGLEMSEWISMGDWRLFFINRDRIEAVKPSDVTRVAQKYLKKSNRTLGQFTPEEKPDRTEIPKAPNVEDLVRDYKGKKQIAQGEAFDPSPENIESRTFKAEATNGMKMAFLPKKTRGQAVQVNLYINLGNEKSLMGKGTIGSLTAAMLDRGTTKMSRQEIKDKFDQLKARVFLFGSATRVSARIETTKDNLSEVIKTVKEILRDPAFPQDEFDKLVEERLAGIEQQKSEPTAQAARLYSKHFNAYPKGHPRYAMSMEEEIEAIQSVKREDLKAFYDQFYGMDNAQMSIVGDFEKDEIEKLSKDMMGDWKAKESFQRISFKINADAPINKNLETPDKANAFFLAGMQMPLSQDSKEFAALTLGNFMLGGGFLNSRLATRIRQKEGLSYGVGSNFSANPADKYATFTAYAIYAPENVEKLEKAFKEEIQKVIDEGFTKEEIEAAKSGWLQSREVSRAQDNSLANMLNSNLYFERDMMWDKALEEKVESLTAKEIQDAFKKHISLDKITIIKAGDFVAGKKRLEEQESKSESSAPAESGGKDEK